MVGCFLLLLTSTQSGTAPPQVPQRLHPLRFRHEAAVVDAALAGSRLYTLDTAGFLSAWETSTDRRFWRVDARGARRLASSADGSLLVAIGPDGLRVVDVASGAERRRFAAAGRPSLSADGRILAVPDGRRIRRWIVGTGEERPPLDNEQEIRVLAVSGQGTRIAAADAGGWAWWDAETGERTFRKQEAFPSMSLALSDDGRRLAVGDLWDTRVYELRAAEARLLRTTSMIAGEALVFSRGGDHLAGVHRGRFAQIWDLASDESVAEWRVEGDPSAARLALSSDGEAVLQIRGNGLQILSGKKEVPMAAAFLPDGRPVTASADGLRIWDLATGWGERSPLPLPAVEFSSDADTLLLRDARTVVVWNRAQAKESFRLDDEGLEIAALSPDGAQVAVHAGRTSVWDVARGVPRAVSPAPQTRVSALAFSPNGRFVAKGHTDGSLTLQEVATGRDILQFAPRGTTRITRIAFSPDGERIATGDADGDVRVWEEGKQPILSQSHGHAVSALAFSPDGRQVVGGAWGNAVLVSSSELPHTVALRLREAGTDVLAVSSDGRRLLTADRSGAILVCSLAEEK